jgi:hypothetical protein
MDASVLGMLLLTVASWLDRQEREMLAYLIEENRVLRWQVGERRLRLTDDDRRNLARGPIGWAGRHCARSRPCHAGHVASLAPAAHRAQVDVPQDKKTMWQQRPR